MHEKPQGTSWKTVKVIQAGEGIEVRVNESSHFHPRYTASVSHVRKQEAAAPGGAVQAPPRTSGYLPLRTTGRGPTIELIPISSSVQQALAEAEAWVLERVRAHENALAARRQRDASRPHDVGSGPRPGLKTLAKRDAAAREARIREREGQRPAAGSSDSE